MGAECERNGLAIFDSFPFAWIGLAVKKRFFSNGAVDSVKFGDVRRCGLFAVLAAIEIVEIASI
jgi:hypothetical protein